MRQWSVLGHYPRLVGTVFATALMLLAVACGGSPVDNPVAPSPTGSLAGGGVGPLSSTDGTALPGVLGGMKTELCHRTNGKKGFVKISVAAPAVPAHLDHGDGGIGDPVPGMEGYEFDASCMPVRSAPDCLPLVTDSHAAFKARFTDGDILSNFNTVKTSNACTLGQTVPQFNCETTNYFIPGSGLFMRDEVCDNGFLRADLFAPNDSPVVNSIGIACSGGVGTVPTQQPRSVGVQHFPRRSPVAATGRA